MNYLFVELFILPDNTDFLSNKTMTFIFETNSCFFFTYINGYKNGGSDDDCELQNT